MKKTLLTTLCAIITTITAIAQNPIKWQWHNPLSESIASIGGKGFTTDNYSRLPNDAKGKVRADVWHLSRNSAGLSINFSTDAKDITVRYTIAGGHSMPHMPSTGINGVDLYTAADNRCVGNYSFADTITYRYTELDGAMTDYRLYLPLYNTVTWLEIGTPDGTAFSFVPAPTEAPIVVYGTSIAHGACASRPGLAWTTMLSRELKRPLVDLGFSGNGKLEPEVLEYICAIPASVYIIDCMPNMYVDSTTIERLATEAVRQVRAAHSSTPILMVEHPGEGNWYTNRPSREKINTINAAQKRAYSALIKEGIKGLHYMTREEIAMPKDGMVDNIHPADLGMAAYCTAYVKKLRKILK